MIDYFSLLGAIWKAFRKSCTNRQPSKNYPRMWLRFSFGVNRSRFVIFQDNCCWTQQRSWYICDKERFTSLTCRPPSFHIPFSPAIASRNNWQTLRSPFHVRIFYPPYFSRSLSLTGTVKPSSTEHALYGHVYLHLWVYIPAVYGFSQ